MAISKVDQFKDTSEEFSIFSPISDENRKKNQKSSNPRAFSNEAHDENADDLEEPEEGL